MSKINPEEGSNNKKVRRKILTQSLREKCPNTELISGPYFPVRGLNTERYGVSLCIQYKCEKIRTKINSVFGYFSLSELHSNSLIPKVF